MSALPAVLSTEDTGGRGARPGHAETVQPPLRESIFRPLVEPESKIAP